MDAIDNYELGGLGSKCKSLIEHQSAFPSMLQLIELQLNN